jgi:hypothetical protein
MAVDDLDFAQQAHDPSTRILTQLFRIRPINEGRLSLRMSRANHELGQSPGWMNQSRGRRGRFRPMALRCGPPRRRLGDKYGGPGLS